MGKRISKTLAREIADRTMAVVNPANRAVALRAALSRHGFGAREPEQEVLNDRDVLVQWLMATFTGE